MREYVYLNGQPLAQIDDVSSSDVLTYLHVDHLGTPKFGTNTGGTQVWAANADAFGVGTPSGSVTVNIRMPGQYYDSESSLFYNWNRYYNPAIGRYISSDPIGLAGGLNTFNYANVSPVMYVDPNGHHPLLLLFLATAAGVTYSNPAHGPTNSEDVAKAEPGSPIFGPAFSAITSILPIPTINLLKNCPPVTGWIDDLLKSFSKKADELPYSKPIGTNKLDDAITQYNK